MIYNNKIESAANKHIETEYARYNSGDVEEEMICLRGKDSFKAGAEWAINDFLKNLWHQTDEEPERMKEILAYGFYSTTIVRWCPNGYITWKDYYEKWHYTKWLYVSDLFPKEGGNQ